MKKSLKMSLFMAAMTAVMATPAFAAEAAVAATQKSGGLQFSIIVVILVVSGMVITAVGAGWAQCRAIQTAVEGIARNPGASAKILPTLLIGLAMIESLAIYVLVIAFILLFTNPFLKFIS